MSTRQRFETTIAACIALGATALQAANTAPVGGGTTRAGLRGAYFANPDFEGKPAFTRRDVRIMHDWKEGPAGKGLPVGGATTPGMDDFPADDFSIRWTGQLVARFSEPYTFRVTGHDGVRFTLGGKILVNSLDKGVVKTVEMPMKKGEKVALVFDYVDRAGTDTSQTRLEWSSPSTPWEVIEPLSFAQTCGHQAAPQTWLAKERADLKREAVQWKTLPEKNWKKGMELSQAEMDENGWPTIANVQITLTYQYHGRHMIRFQGKANIEAGSWWHSGGPLVWMTRPDGSGKTYDLQNSKGRYNKPMLPKGAGYDEKTNMTTAWFDLTDDISGLALLITDAERAPGKPGICNLQVLGPVAGNSQEHHQPGEIRKRQAREVFDHFIVDRLHIGMSLNKGWTWDQRTQPGYHAREHAVGWGYCLEEYIMMVNEGGMDWHICCGAGWDQDYMKKFAQIVRYGSDGVNPYTKYVENPKYPPLNPNLRIYIEHSNELPWAVYPRFIWDDLKKKYADGHPDITIVNYDGKCKNADAQAMFRYHALRMKQLSDAFREVYADVPDAMGDRARVYCFGQYTASHMNNMLQFLDNYFNKGDTKSTYEGEPHPPSYYIWGGGGAIYYGCNNKFGLMEKEALTNGGFEDGDIPTGKAALRPTDAGWTFTGNAGICDVRLLSRQAVSVEKLPAEPIEPPAKECWVGFKFTVGDADLFVYKLGRWISKAHRESNFWRSRSLEMKIVDEKGATMANFYGPPRIATFEDDRFAWWWCAEKAWGKGHFLPALLPAGKTYYLICKEKGGADNDRFFGPVAVRATQGIKVEAAVTGDGKKSWQEKSGSLTYGPVNMVFTTEPLQTADGKVGVPPDCSAEVFFASWSSEPRKPPFTFNEQCAFMQGDSTMRQTFTVDQPGAYWITFNPCMDRLSNAYKKQGWGGWTCDRGGGTIRVKIDGQDVTVSKLLPGGGYESRLKVFHYAATDIFKLEPGEHTVTFERVNSEGSTAFIDEIHLSSENAFYGGLDSPNFPAGGAAFGQNPATGYHRTSQAECEMAKNWGLIPCTYEGGWAVQGDFDHYSMNAWNDLRYGSEATNEELTKQALRNAFNTWCEYGGYIYAYFYPIMNHISQTNAPLYLCVQEMNDRLSVPPKAGVMLPGELTPELHHSEGGLGSYSASWSQKKEPAKLPAHGWKSWIVTSSNTAHYKVTLIASGGPCELRVDDRIVAGGKAEENLSAEVKLVAGVHAIKVKAGEQTLKIERIAIK